MKRLVQFRWWLPALACLVLVLAACERPINSDDVDPTADTILPATLPVSTIDPNVQPTTDPATAATAVPEATTDPAATAVPEATTAPETTSPRGEVTHTVVAGDTLTGLSLLYDIAVDVIVSANNLTNVDSLDIGQVLIIPAEGTVVVAATAVPGTTATAVPPVTTERTHIVQAGENLYRIGLQYGFTYQELASYNNIPDPNDLDVGQVIKIPPSN
jgi:LysM repeat protein